MKETIITREKKLFEDWRQSDCWHDAKKAFVMDGVVDETTFLQQPYRFVFILKEANQMGEMPLPDFLKEGAPHNGGHTWNPVCRWLTGENKCFSVQERAKILRKIAVVNLKKEDGGAITDMNNLRQVVKRDKDFIKKQLDIYIGIVPIVFVCCGTGILSMINDYILGCVELKKNKTLAYAKPYNSEVYYVAFNHPNCRKSGLTERFREITSIIKTSP